MKNKYKVENLHCHNCANEIIEKLEQINYINEVYIDYDNKEITIVGEKMLTQEQVDKVIADIISENHPHESFEHFHNMVTEEFNFEDIDCPNCASKVERALNKQEDIIDARVNFLNKKIIIRHLNNVEVYDIVSKIVSRVEGGAKVFKEEQNSKKHHNHQYGKHHEHKCDCKDYEHHHEHECDCGHNHKHECDCEHHHEHKGCCCGHHHEHHHKSKKIYKILMTIGLALFIIATIISLISKYGNLENKELVDKINYMIFVIGYILIGYDILWGSIKNIINKDFFSENLLMTIASIGALIINEPFEATMVILLFKIGEKLENKATDKSKQSIKNLLELKADYVTLTNGEKKLAKDVSVGEIITVKVGEKIPLDGTLKGEGTEVDMKALTGESRPIYIESGDEILSGSINLTKVVQIEVTKESNESTISKMLKLVEEASNQKSKTEEFITKFARIYTPLVLIIALIIGVIKFILKDPVNEVFNSVFSILVISCPCALVISIPLGYFAGIGKLSSFGILVKGGNYIEAISQSKTFIFDKTGTITKGNFKVVEVNPIKGISKDELINKIANVERYSNHPIANSILEYGNHQFGVEDSVNIEEISGRGLKLINEINGKEIKTLVGNEYLLEMYNIPFEKCKSVGTIVYLAENDKYLGNVVIRDEIKETSKEVINFLNKKFHTIMLTGDTEDVANLVASEVGIKEVKSQLLPKQKYDYLKKVIKESEGKVCYIGDGINDAPSLKLADVGIAMGGKGSDSAKETADIVIMNDDLVKIKETLLVSKYTKKIIIQNIVMSLGIKLIAMVIGVIGILGSYAMLLGVFADVGVCLLAILNTFRIMRLK